MALTIRFLVQFTMLLQITSGLDGSPFCHSTDGCASSFLISTLGQPMDVSGYTALPELEAQDPFSSTQAAPKLLPSSSNDDPGSPSNRSSKPLVMAYYPDWVGDTFPPQKIDFGRFDWIDFAFAVPALDLGLEWDDPRAPDSLRSLVLAAHAQGKKVKLSIGGWTGSRFFSNAVSTEDNRRKFANNILFFYTSYNLDGIDIDWEYPGAKGANGNTWNADDADNYLLFLQTLRVVLPLDARITAAVATMPFIGGDGKPMTNVTAFAKVLDWVLIMNYDVWGSSSKPGPNAPLRDGCGNSTQPESSAVGALTSWTSAGFPACQLVLGLPSYGYISSSTASRLRTRATASSKPKPKKAKPNTTGIVKVMNEDGATQGQIQFKDLIKEGVLKRSNSTGLDASNSFTGANGFVVTYDDPESLSLKAAFAREAGMLGVNIFDVHGDTEDWELIDAVRKALGLSAPSG